MYESLCMLFEVKIIRIDIYIKPADKGNIHGKNQKL